MHDEGKLALTSVALKLCLAFINFPFVALQATELLSIYQTIAIYISHLEIGLQTTFAGSRQFLLLVPVRHSSSAVVVPVVLATAAFVWWKA